MKTQDTARKATGAVAPEEFRKEKQLDSTERIALLLAILSNLKRYAVISIAELAQQVGVGHTALSQDLKALSYAGIPPFGGGDLVPIEIDEEDYLCVTAKLPSLDRPIRLTPEETEACILALDIAGFAENDPLLKRLTASVARDFDLEAMRRMFSVVRGRHTPEIFRCLSLALDTSCALEIDYINNEGASSLRIVEPVALFLERDSWYLSAFDRSRKEQRHFRVDNIRAAHPVAAPEQQHTKETGAVDTAAAPAPNSIDLSSAASCRIRFSPAEAFHPEQWPGAREVSRQQDCCDVDVPFLSTKWIARQVIAAHGHAQLRFPAQLRDAVYELAASRLTEMDALAHASS
jgi:predicted DNA-binding transcriptional regulator YafY